MYILRALNPLELPEEGGYEICQLSTGNYLNYGDDIFMIWSECLQNNQ